MVEAKWGSLASVFDRFGGECLIMPVQEAVMIEKRENHEVILLDDSSIYQL